MRTKVIVNKYKCDKRGKDFCKPLDSSGQIKSDCHSCPCRTSHVGYIDGYSRFEAVVVFKDRIEVISLVDSLVDPPIPIGFMNEADIRSFFSEQNNNENE